MWEYLGLLSPAVRYIYWKLCLNTRPASAVPAVHQLKRPDPDLNDGLVISPGAQLRGTIPWRWIPLTKNYANWTKDIELPQRASYFFSFSFFFFPLVLLKTHFYKNREKETVPTLVFLLYKKILIYTRWSHQRHQFITHSLLHTHTKKGTGIMTTTKNNYLFFLLVLSSQSTIRSGWSCK